MKIGVFIFLTIFCLRSLALEYRIDENTFLNPSFSQRYKITEHFEKFGLFAFSQRNLSAVGLPFDTIYSDLNLNRKIIIKAGIQVSQEMKGKIVSDRKQNLMVFHFDFDGVPYFLLALNYSEADLKKILNPWIHKEYSRLQWMMPSQAFASEPCLLSNSPVQRLTDIKSDVSQNAIVKTVSQCGADAIANATESTKKSLDFFKKFLSNPSELWKEVKKSAEEIVALSLNFKVELSGIFESLSSLSEQQATQVICSIAGSLVAKALTGGGVVAFGALLPKVLVQLKKISSLMKEASLLEKNGILLPSKSFITQEALNCAL